MMKNKLTLVIVIHNHFDAVDFYNELLIKNRSNMKGIEVLFIFDCQRADIRSEAIDILEKNNYRYHVNEKNIGKLKTIYTNIKKINTPYFKIIDQDDSLYLENIQDLINKISDLPDDLIIKHKALKVYDDNKGIFLQSLDDDIIKQQLANSRDVSYSQQTNCDTIYPTKVISLMNRVDFTEQKFHNDVLLSNFCIGLGSKKVKIDIGFYIQFHNAGQTNKFNPERSRAIPELYKNYVRINKEFEMFNFRLIMNGKKFYHTNFIKAFTKKYMKNYNKNDGLKLYKESREILNNCWKGVEND